MREFVHGHQQNPDLRLKDILVHYSSSNIICNLAASLLTSLNKELAKELRIAKLLIVKFWSALVAFRMQRINQGKVGLKQVILERPPPNQVM